jgi:hypothetical protein
MDELTRFAQRLVEQLGASGEGVHRPVEVAALRETVLPYRTHRRALGIESVEDYETILLRLVAGERGYVKTVPAEAAKRCREELTLANPDLAVLDEVAAATVQITSMAAAQIVDAGGDGRTGGRPVSADGEVSADGGVSEVSEVRPVAPARAAKPARKVVPSSPSSPSSPSPLSIPSPPPSPSSPSSLSTPSPPSPLSSRPMETCTECHRPIPSGRQVVFCPWCAKRLIPFTCPRCNTELDSAWRHCITCGASVKDPFSYP